MTRLELIGVLVIVAVIVAFVVWLAWGQIRMLARRADRRIFADELGIEDGEEYDVVVRAGTAQPGPVPAHYASGGWAWPPVPADELPQRVSEPVRDSFRRMLEGGPDYHG